MRSDVIILTQILCPKPTEHSVAYIFLGVSNERKLMKILIQAFQFVEKMPQFAACSALSSIFNWIFSAVHSVWNTFNKLEINWSPLCFALFRNSDKNSDSHFDGIIKKIKVKYCKIQLPLVIFYNRV